MVTDTEAMVLRQVKTLNGRRMLLLFTKKFGKISVGTNLTEGGKNKSALVVRPFTYGRYELFKGRENYSLNSGQVLKSYYGIGENLDKYMAASYVLELTEKLLAEDLPQPRMFALLLDFCSFLAQALSLMASLLHLLALMLQLGKHIFKILVALPYQIIRFLEDILRKSQLSGNGKGVGFAGDADEQLIGRTQSLYIEFA